MKFPKCGGEGKYFKKEKGNSCYVVSLSLCDMCHGSGEVEMTNEEWLKHCNTEQLAEWLQEHMDCSNCDCNKDLCYKGYDCCELAFKEWLKQPHREEKHE